MIEDKGFFEKLHKISEEKQTLLCVGLDPHISELTEQTAEAAKTFCKNLIDQTFEVTACYKPNSAFFERFGTEGL